MGQGGLTIFVSVFDRTLVTYALQNQDEEVGILT